MTPHENGNLPDRIAESLGLIPQIPLALEGQLPIANTPSSETGFYPELPSTVDAMQGYGRGFSQRRPDRQQLPPLSQPSQQNPEVVQYNEPPVTKKRWYDGYVWGVLGNPKDVASKVARKPEGFLNRILIRNALHNELKEIHFSDSKLFLTRSVARFGRFVRSGVTNSIIRVATAGPEAVPVVGEAFAALFALLGGRTNELKLHALNALIIDAPQAAFLAFVVLPAQAVPIVGQAFGIATGLTFVSIDLWVNASARKHAREVNNQLIPKLATVMLSSNPQVLPKKQSIARAIVEEYRGGFFARKAKLFQELTSEQRHLNPQTGLSKRERAWYVRDSNSIQALGERLNIYENILNPAVPLRPDLTQQRIDAVTVLKLPTSNPIARWWRYKNIERDTKTLRYLYETYVGEKLLNYDHPFREASRMRAMALEAKRFYPEIEVEKPRRRR